MSLRQTRQQKIMQKYNFYKNEARMFKESIAKECKPSIRKYGDYIKLEGAPLQASRASPSHTARPAAWLSSSPPPMPTSPLPLLHLKFCKQK